MYRYRSLDAWKRAHTGALMVLRATDTPQHPRVRAIFDQLRRAAVSVEANIVEGYALGTGPNYRRHLRIAMGSAAEAECLARLAGEMGYLSDTVVKDLELVLGATMRAMHGLIRHAKAPLSS